VIHVTLDIAEESIQRRAVLYDKEGDYHFDTISAFIKSLRGSDPDAAVYWMAKMIYAGEAPRFIFRRMLIFAGEDVGMADPNAIQVVTACASAFEQVGLPEGRFHLGLAALYLATCKKSNSAFAFFDALTTVENEADSGVPSHLRDANRDAEGFGHGEGYLYPHAFRDHWVAQQYLPTSLQGKVFYEPSDQGYEDSIRVQVARRREAQLAAMLAVDGEESGEILTFSAADPARDRWLQRTISGTGERLAGLRDRVLDACSLARHSAVLDLRTGSGLLTWEALRRVPEGGVYTLARSARDAEAVRDQAQRLPEPERPIVLQGAIEELPGMLMLRSMAEHPDRSLYFEAVVGHNALIDVEDKAAAVGVIAEVLAPSGVVSLADRVPRHTQRLYALVDLGGLDGEVAERLRAAEEAIYDDAGDALVNWGAGDLAALFSDAGFTVVWETEDEHTDVRVTAGLLDRWFADEGSGGDSGRPSYARRLSAQLSSDEIARVEETFRRQLLNQVVDWRSRTVYLVGRK
jgi:putative ATPase